MSKKMICEWTEIEEFNWMIFWESDCSHSFQFTEGGTPTDNEFAYCPFCGKVLSVKSLAKELELDAQRQADEYLESEDAHIEVTDD